ncbi:MAG: acyl CoA:acetate/3-ketoacid CoA transferase [Cetobacterium sp.]
MKDKFITVDKIASIIANRSFIATCGFVGIGVAEEIFIEIEKSFLKNGYPNNLGIIFAAGFGDGKTRGLNHLAHEGLLDTVIGGHWGLSPKLGELANDNKIKGYNLPQGVIAQMFRDMAGKKPGTISRVGIDTFVDPKIQGGKINNITTKNIVETIEIENEKYLFYKFPKIDIAILRGTSADGDGNISFEEEALTLEALSVAMATKNAGGKVIVQVKNKLKKNTINPKDVIIPGIFVDYVVVTKDLNNHMQTFDQQFNEAFTKNNIIIDENQEKNLLDERKVIARRCALLLDKTKRVLNYGIGIPEKIADVLKEENQEKLFIPTVEPGAIGGTPMGGMSFGASLNPIGIIDQPYQFDFYDGGGLDVTFLGLAQCDSNGNINVSKFGPKIAGCGGFINISQNAKEVVFCGTFTAGGLELSIESGELKILKEGRLKKFIKEVEQITFSGNFAINNNKKVFYITERAVFELQKEGLTLIEIAKGINLEKDVLNQMEFKPKISKNLKFMDRRIFSNEIMGIEF